jgi:hypothetical protein
MTFARSLIVAVALAAIALSGSACGQAAYARSGTPQRSVTTSVSDDAGSPLLRDLAACLDTNAKAGRGDSPSEQDAVVLLIVSCQPQADAFSRWCALNQTSSPTDCAHVVFVTAQGALNANGR